MSMYIASLSRLTMLFNLAVWSTAGKTWGSRTSCWLNNPREKARPIQAPRAPTGASVDLSKIGEPTDGLKTTQTARNLGRIRQVRIILCTKTYLDFKLMYLLADLASFAGILYTTTRQDSAAMSMYIASLSRLTMLFNLAVWSTAGKTWGSRTSCWLNNPREKARPIQAPRAPTGASVDLFKLGEPTDGLKTTQTARNLGRIRQVRIILCTKTYLDFKLM